MQEEREYKKSTIISKGSDAPKSDKSRHYVSNVDFYNALVERRDKIRENAEKGLPPPRVTDFIGKCLYQIANNLSMKFYFRSYPFREDMVAESVAHMLKYIDSFDPDITKNPFSYMTQTAYYNFLETIKNEKSALATKFRCTLEMIATQEVAEHDEDYHNMIAEENLPDVGVMSDFVRKYEVSLEKKRKRPVKEVNSEYSLENMTE